jgi:hypothetical protein
VAPNSAFVSPESPDTVFGGSVTSHYRAGEHSELTFGGGYFSNRQSGPGLPNTRSYHLEAGYTKMFRRGQTIGLTYSFQSFDVTNPMQQVMTHSALVTYGYAWRAGRQITFFGGPQYSLVGANSVSSAAGQPITLTGATEGTLGYSAGAEVSIFITQQNFFQAMASHRITDGAGVSGTVVQTEGQSEFSRRFNERLTASVGLFYSKYNALGDLPIVVPNTWGVFTSAVFNINPRSNIQVNFDYFHQPQIPSIAAPLFSHHFALVEYHYTFGRLPGGR